VPRTGSKNRFPSKVAKNRFASKVPKQGFQEQVPKTGFQARFAGKGFQGQVSRTGLQEQVSKNKFPSEVTNQGFPSKAPSNRFASKVSRHRCPSKVFVVGLSQTAPKHHSNKQLLTLSYIYIYNNNNKCCCWGYLLGFFFRGARFLRLKPSDGSTIGFSIVIGEQSQIMFETTSWKCAKPSIIFLRLRLCHASNQPK